MKGRGCMPFRFHKTIKIAPGVKYEVGTLRLADFHQ